MIRNIHSGGPDGSLKVAVADERESELISSVRERIGGIIILSSCFVGVEVEVADGSISGLN